MVFLRNSTFHDVSRGQNPNPWFYVGSVVGIEEAGGDYAIVRARMADGSIEDIAIWGWYGGWSAHYTVGNDSYDVMVTGPDGLCSNKALRMDCFLPDQTAGAR